MAVIPALLPLFILSFLFFYAHSRILHVLPSKEFYALGYRPFTEHQTRIASFNADAQKIRMEYSLDGSLPVAGIGLNLARKFPLLDLTGYAVLRIKISTEKKTSCCVTIRTFEPGITEVKESDFIPARHKEIRSELNPIGNTLVFPLKNFNDPDWWITEYANGQSLEKKPFRYCYILQIFFDDINLAGQTNRIDLEEVSFHVFPAFFWIVFFAVIFGYYGLFAVFFFIRPLNRKEPDTRDKLLTSYKKIEKSNYREKDTERIYKYINENYNDPGISLDTIVAATGLSRKRITALVQQEYNMALKECINLIRLTEAKRLLLETDLDITEIAFNLGYSSSSYFGVLFKTQVGVTPKEYRKKNQQ